MLVILGSASPRRKDMISSLINDFEIVKPDVDESLIEGEDPVDYAIRIAEKKGMRALEISGAGSESRMIISGDTIVVLEKKIFGKPENHEAAVQMLLCLQGKTHDVISGLSITVADLEKNNTITLAEKTSVTFKQLSADAIEKYLSTINYIDKAGSYAFQHNGSMIIESYSGSTTNIIGFPLRLFFRMVIDMGLTEIFYS